MLGPKGDTHMVLAIVVKKVLVSEFYSFLLAVFFFVPNNLYCTVGYFVLSKHGANIHR